MLFLGIVAAFIINSSHGLADNGDFFRNWGLFSSGPVDLDLKPEAGTKEWHDRYFRYWLPYWQLDPAIRTVPTSSVVLTWIPGMVVSSLFSSGNVVHVSVVTILLKGLVLIFFLMVLRWIDAQSAEEKLTLYCCLALLLVLMFSAADYQAYFNSFYQEPASLAFGAIFFASLLLLPRAESTKPLIYVSIPSLLFFATSRISLLYWAVLGPVALGVALAQNPRHSKSRIVMGTAVGMLAGALLIGSATVVLRASGSVTNTYHSLFMGSLTFSENPGAHLARLHMSEAENCIGFPAYSERGTSCREHLAAHLSIGATLKVLIWEPRIISTMIGYAAGRMQDLSLNYLGTEAKSATTSHDALPDGDLVAQESRAPSQCSSWLNAWSVLKYHVFPRSGLLIGTLILFTGVCGYNLRRGFHAELSLVGLLSAVGSFIEMMVAILGEGKNELIKHLFAANFFFDFSVIIVISLLILGTTSLLRER